MPKLTSSTRVNIRGILDLRSAFGLFKDYFTELLVPCTYKQYIVIELTPFAASDSELKFLHTSLEAGIFQLISAT